MRPIFLYIRQFYTAAFKWHYFLLIVILLGIILYLNYEHLLELKYIAAKVGYWERFWGYYLLYFIPFSIAFLLQLLFFKNCTYYKKCWFWIICLMAPAFFSFRINFNFHKEWILQLLNTDNRQFWLYCINWIIRIIVLLIPVLIIWYIKDKNYQPFYGMRRLLNLQPYLIMLLIMVPLVIVAGTQEDFLHMYPKAKILTGLPFPATTKHYLLYEICYGADFISIEFFFRGFLILSLVKICGLHAIIPVASFYCMIHLGKPLGEAISSFFGGVLLGIISYYTRSIWGGCMVHIGIAWLMEIAGWAGNLLHQ